MPEPQKPRTHFPRPRDRNRVVIETPLEPPESRADRARRKLGVVDRTSQQWWDSRLKPEIEKA